ncbi:SH3 domain-containing protein [Ruegeria arenilitoris]|uniref:SH3 domain-containing protein n=1 Tax=Ruegeria arenilitoris TaxID=1173585 RepID=UPI00147EF371|nr:SH3 domain-containing protein [Ruegeria arenilitoris]
MTRLITVTFAVLGWTFYVASGGPDFEPRGERGTQPERVASVSEVAPKPVPQAQELVTKVTVRAVPDEVELKPKVAPKPKIVSEEVVEFIEEPEAQPLIGFSTFNNQGANLTLASLEEGAAGLQQISTDAQSAVTPTTSVLTEPEQDIREISGTRVNLRDGPGTIYPVIGKATLGQRVEVISESGTGWLRLRLLPQQQMGWVSASLVRKPNN